MGEYVTRCIHCGRFIKADDMINDTFGEMEMSNGVTAIMTLCTFCSASWIGDALWSKINSQKSGGLK